MKIYEFFNFIIHFEISYTFYGQYVYRDNLKYRCITQKSLFTCDFGSWVTKNILLRSYHDHWSRLIIVLDNLKLHALCTHYYAACVLAFAHTRTHKINHGLLRNQFTGVCVSSFAVRPPCVSYNCGECVI